MTTTQKPYPSVFEGMNLDQVNAALRSGHAIKEQAEQLVTWWNTSGKRFTVARLGVRSVQMFRHGPVIDCPVITISND